jgi:hypothetical protein
MNVGVMKDYKLRDLRASHVILLTTNKFQICMFGDVQSSKNRHHHEYSNSCMHLVTVDDPDATCLFYKTVRIVK